VALLETTPVVFALDEDGDLIIPLRRLAGIPAVVQGVRTRLLMFRGEWFLNLGQGVPWMRNETVSQREAILGSKLDRAKAHAAVREQILATPGINRILALRSSFDPATRSLTITWRANTVFGDTDPDTLTIAVEA
jgi:hypothetical protein